MGVSMSNGSVRSRSGWIATLLLSWSAACAVPVEPGAAETSEPPKVAVTVEKVVGGKPTDPCDWPSTVDVNGCTGTLIHPRVVTTAGHCLSGTSASGRVTSSSTRINCCR